MVLAPQVYECFTFSTSAMFMRTSWWVQVLARSYSKANTHVSKPARLNTSFSCRSEISRSCCCCCCLFALKFRFRNIYWPPGSTELSQRRCIYHQTDKTSWWESGVTADKLGEGADSRRQEWLLSAGVSLVGALRPFWDEMINLFICLFVYFTIRLPKPLTRWNFSKLDAIEGN